MSPDRVLSLVVLHLAIFMILSVSYLSYSQIKVENATASFISASNKRVQEIYSSRQQQVLGAQDEIEEGGSDVEVTE